MRAITRIATFLIPAFSAALLPATMGTAATIQPGRWSTEGRITSIRAPQLPPQVTEMMTKRPTTFSYCLSAEDAAKGPQKMLEESQKQNGQCKFVRYDMKGQSVNAVMECKSKEMGVMRITMDGTFTATSYQTRTVMEGNGPFQQMTVLSTGKLTGPCK